MRATWRPPITAGGPDKNQAAVLEGHLWMAVPRNLRPLSRSSLGRRLLVQIRVDGTLWGARKPRFARHVRQLFHADALEANQDGRISVEMRSREIYSRFACKQGFLHFEPVSPHAQDLTRGCVRAKRFSVRAAQRTFPHEELIVDGPGAMVVRRLLARSWKRERDAPHVMPRSHTTHFDQAGGQPSARRLDRGAFRCFRALAYFFVLAKPYVF